MNGPGNEPNPVALLGKVLLVCSLSLKGELGKVCLVCPEASGIWYTRVGILLVCNLFLGAPRGGREEGRGEARGGSIKVCLHVTCNG